MPTIHCSLSVRVMALKKLCNELRDHQGDIHELVLGQDRCCDAVLVEVW